MYHVYAIPLPNNELDFVMPPHTILTQDLSYFVLGYVFLDFAEIMDTQG